MQYAGTSVNYAIQSELREKLHSTIDSITDFLRGEGYYGTVGADVLETRDGKQYVIDLNVRWTSSWILGTLRKHFYGSEVGLGLRRARLVMMHFEVGMKEFEEVMEEELSEGRVAVVARFELDGKSWVHLVVGGWEWGDVERVVGKMEGLCGREAEEDGD
jgi:predicted ATP-grasp superfamily ATP-dependent carboligase